jgi:hypothetical protein
MNKVETVRSALDFPSPEESEALLAGDFQSTDEVGLGSQPIDKATWIRMGGMMKASFPDIELVIEEIREEGDGVKVVGHFVGTFTNDFDLTPLTMSVIPASGEKLTWPSGASQVTVEGGRFTRVHNTDTGPDARLAGFLRPLGVG